MSGYMDDMEVYSGKDTNIHNHGYDSNTLPASYFTHTQVQEYGHNLYTHNFFSFT